MTWEALNLTAPEFAIPSEPPSVAGLLYHGKRHLLSGPPESLKTLVALIVALEAIRAGGTVAMIDFENGPAETRRLLKDLGATEAELQAALYFEPDTPPDDADIDRIAEAGVTLAIIDALAGAYGTAGLDDNKRAEAERFSAVWIKPLWNRGVATLAVDHVVKNTDARGKFSIGSERKLGAADVHLGLTVIRPLHRGSTGLVRVTTHKDRPGHLPRPHATEIELHSDPITHAITWEIRAATTTAEDGGGWQPTLLMQRVSEYLEVQTDEVPVSAIYRDVKGKRAYLIDAVRFLVSSHHISEREGNHGSRLIRITKPFRAPVPDSSPPYPNHGSPLVPPVPPSTEGNGNGNGNHAATSRLDGSGECSASAAHPRLLS